MSLHFQDSVLIVTGAASGIGRQLALQGAKRGAVVIAGDKNTAALAETKQMGASDGLQMEVFTLDVSNKEAINDFAATVIPTLDGRRLVLINNAGVGLFSGKFQHTALDDFEDLVNINLWGVIRMTKAFYPYFVQQNRGHIVNISSVFGLAGITGQSAYCTSKFGVRGFTETLRMELAGTGILTTCVHPGGIKTNIMRAATPKGPEITEAMHLKSIAEFDEVAMTTPDKAARLILDAVKNKKQRLLIGKDARAMDIVTRLVPVGYTKIFKRTMDRVFRDKKKNDK